MAEIVQLAPLQIHAKAYFEFLQYFIDHIDEFPNGPAEQRAVRDWKRKEWSDSLLHHPHNIINTKLEHYEKIPDRLIIQYECNSLYDTIIFCYDDNQPLELMLSNALSGHIDFLPWYEDLQYLGMNRDFKRIIARKFLETYPTAILQKWRNMGVRIYVND